MSDKKVTFGASHFAQNSNVDCVSCKTQETMLKLPVKSSMKPALSDIEYFSMLSREHYKYLWLLKLKRTAIGSLKEKTSGLKRNHDDCTEYVKGEIMRIVSFIRRTNEKILDMEIKDPYLMYEDPGLWLNKI